MYQNCDKRNNMDDILRTVFGYLIEAFVISLQQIFILIGPGIMFALLMNYLAGFVQKNSYSLMGTKIYLSLFGWFGTMIHELGHAIFCVLFRHRINKMKLFSFNPKSDKLGYVNHSYNPNSIYQSIGNFFIGIGPILFGSVVIYGLGRLLLSPDILQSIEILRIKSTDTGVWEYSLQVVESVWNGVRMLSAGLFDKENLTDWRLYLFVYVVFCIRSSITLSPADMKGAGRGLVAFVGVLFFFNIATYWIIDNDLAETFQSFTRYYSFFYTTMLFAIALNIMAFFILFVISLGLRLSGLKST